MNWARATSSRQRGGLISWEHDIFYAWFVLQHFRGYIPFITRVSNSHDVSFLKQLR